MTLALGNDAAAALLDGFDAFVNTGSSTANLTVYQTNTALAVFPLSATAFGSAVAGSLVLASVPISSTGTEVAGTANRFVITSRDGDPCLSGTIGGLGSGADIETPHLTVTAAATQTLNAFILLVGSDGALGVVGSFTFV
ncbi:MAG TPA: hypothetical protein VFM95_02645 [Microcella sp.]|nr:hypothetical protein [Microcella sp.]